MRVMLDIPDFEFTKICEESDKQGCLVEDFCLRAIKDRLTLKQVQESIHISNVQSAQITLQELTALCGCFNEARNGFNK